MHRSFLIGSAIFFSAACTAQTAESSEELRGPLGKADNTGSCAQTSCDGKSPNGTCWCDAQCSQYGDCCGDYVAACMAPTPTAVPTGDANAVPVTGSVPEFGSSPTITTFATAADGLDEPTDLGFNSDRPGELWTVNRGNDGVVILFNAGKSNQTTELRVDAFANHFMAFPSSMSFGDDGLFASCQESRNTYGGHHPMNDFMGPTLWDSDLSIFAAVHQEPNGQMLGSHIDMLHESPNCMGIEYNGSGNQYWVFDGLYGHIVYYDFQTDHGPGYDDHSDGIVRRYPEARVRRKSGVPSHLALDAETGWLYIADTGNHRVTRLDTNTGAVQYRLELMYEALREYSQMGGASVESFVNTGVTWPSGIALRNGRVFVSDYADGDIAVFDPEGDELARIETGAAGIAGIEFDSAGKLWFVDAKANTVNRINP